MRSIQLPDGFERLPLNKNSFGEYLRNFPLKRKGSSVYLYNGNEKSYQNYHYAVLRIDTGKKDLQQCADAVMRLRAEYLFSQKQYNRIQFNITSGDSFPYSRWANGYRPYIKNNRLYYQKKSGISYDYPSFKKYLEFLFIYAGSYSLSREMAGVSNINQIKPGDVFIQGGFPGHAVIVMDTAKNIKTDESVFLLAQSYMPAQDMHILKNLEEPGISPWYSVRFSDRLKTPEWTFYKKDLKKFIN